MDIVGKKYPFELDSESACENLANTIADLIRSLPVMNAGFQVWFYGDLGSGKTTLIRYILKSLGHLGKVKSPTYNLCEPYSILIHDQPMPLHHFDLYRMNHPLEWEEAGFKDILSLPGINFIEWPEKAENTLPPPDLKIHLSYVSQSVREGFIQGHSQLGQDLLDMPV
jgi:tRNA threonylcarbamoyladenosine biosynthesis protein TsaE